MSAPAPALPSVSPRFVDAWQAFQFAAEHAEKCRRLHDLADRFTPGVARYYASQLAEAEEMLRGAEAAWRTAQAPAVTPESAARREARRLP